MPSAAVVRSPEPSWVKATATIIDRCTMGGPSGLAVATSQSRAEPSLQPTPSTAPSGLKASAVTATPLAERRPGERPAGLGVPDPGLVFEVARRSRLSGRQG